MACKEIELLQKYFQGETVNILIGHSRAVADLALQVCDLLGVAAEERLFVEESALLHDIGVCRIHAPKLGLHGNQPYIRHGILGREILEQEGLPLHALVCERHIGVGITVDDIISQDLLLPHRDMTPQSQLEKIVCFADLFYSKSLGKITLRKTPEQVRTKLAHFGDHKLQIFDEWMELFGAAVQ